MKTFKKYNPNKDFTTLVAWQRARELKLFLYSEVLPLLLTEEKFNSKSWRVRNRQHRRKLRQVQSQRGDSLLPDVPRLNLRGERPFDFVSRLYYIPQPVFEAGLTLVERAKVAINGYIRYVKNQDNQPDNRDG